MIMLARVSEQMAMPKRDGVKEERYRDDGRVCGKWGVSENVQYNTVSSR